jgi:hypothetical protein
VLPTLAELRNSAGRVTKCREDFAPTILSYDFEDLQGRQDMASYVDIISSSRV